MVRILRPLAEKRIAAGEKIFTPSNLSFSNAHAVKLDSNLIETNSNREKRI